MLLYDIKHGQYNYELINQNIWTLLNSAKTALDTPFMHNPAASRTIMNMMDPFENCKRQLSNVIPYKVSRAWMKCYEIDTYFDLIKKDTYVWDNCAFPGMFIAAHNHIHATKYNMSIRWVASSLHGSAESLPDTYGLYSNYRSNWLMNAHNDGNVCFSDNLRDFQKQIGQNITLYTSDLGIDASNNYNDQEVMHTDAHYGQAISGLITLAVGGDFVVKQFTFASDATVRLIHTLVQFFTEFYICKTATSAITNSEVYFVGKNFIGITPAECEQLLNKMPATNTKTGGTDIDKNIQYAATDIYTRQIRALRLYTQIIDEYKSLDVAAANNKKIIRTVIARAYYHAMDMSPDDAVRAWMSAHNIPRIHPSKEIVKAAKYPTITQRRA